MIFWHISLCILETLPCVISSLCTFHVHICTISNSSCPLVGVCCCNSHPMLHLLDTTVWQPISMLFFFPPPFFFFFSFPSCSLLLSGSFWADGILCMPATRGPFRPMVWVGRTLVCPPSPLTIQNLLRVLDCVGWQCCHLHLYHQHSSTTDNIWASAPVPSLCRRCILV